MKHLLLLFALFAGLVTASAAEANKYPPVRKDMAQRASVMFRARPTSEQGFAAGAMVVLFAEQSPIVEVVVSLKTMPWLNDKLTGRQGATLIAAYTVGSVGSQLQRGVTKNDPLAGAEQVVLTYQQMKKANPKLSIPAVEKLVELKTKGKLKEYVSSLKA